jgi:4,5-dihydroxyphthalate decarboxylase
MLSLSASALAVPALLSSADTLDQAARPELRVSSYRLDRTAALFSGQVKIDGVDATFVEDSIGDMNTRAFTRNAPNEITELGLHPFMLAHANEGFRDYALLPVFLLRQFRQKSVFVRTGAGIAKPEDLKGRRVGTPGYSSTSLTWIRGIFEDDYGVKPSDMEWVIANKDSSAGEAGKISAQESRIPEGVSVVQGPAGLDESQLLLEGEVDALFHAATPAAFLQGDPRISRLFADPRAVEQDYYQRTGIFPIMHVLAIRRDVAEKYPWLPKAIFDAYCEAKTAAYQLMNRLNWATDMLPWYSAELEATQQLMGRNFYPYGIKANEKTLNALFDYSYRQGLASRRLTIEELFLPGTLEFEEG